MNRGVRVLEVDTNFSSKIGQTPDIICGNNETVTVKGGLDIGKIIGERSVSAKPEIFALEECQTSYTRGKDHKGENTSPMNASKCLSKVDETAESISKR